MQQTTAPLMTQTGEQFLAEGRAAITAAQADVAAFKSLSLDASTELAADALDQVDRTLNRVSGRIHLYSQVHPNGDMREAA